MSKVCIIDAGNCIKSVRFGDLPPIMLQKPDVIEYADSYVYPTYSEFYTRYGTAHYNLGYGDFRADI